MKIVAKNSCEIRNCDFSQVVWEYQFANIRKCEIRNSEIRNVKLRQKLRIRNLYENPGPGPYVAEGSLADCLVHIGNE